MTTELWFRFHPSRFMSGIRGLNANEVKVYICLLCRMYEHSGPVSDNDEVLATYCEMRPSSYRKALDRLIRLGKIQETEDGLFNRLAAEEISQRASKSEFARRAGKKSAEKRQGNQQRSPTDAERPFNDKERDRDKSSVAKATGRVDPAAILFGQCLAYLMEATGKPEGACRKLLGGWKAKHGAAAAVDAVGRAQREGAIDPVAFIEGCFRHHRRKEDERHETFEEEMRRRGFRYVDDDGNFSSGGHHGAPPSRNAANDLPGVLAHEAEEDRPVHERDVQAGRGGLELLALRH